jgi:membrane protein YqaA with SNARE-associated domain
VLFALLASGHSPMALLVVASIGNILGSCVNWLLGRHVARFVDRSWFPVSAEQMAKAELWFRKYGLWSLLLSWVPLIGDPLTLVAGVLRVPFVFFLAIVASAKIARYIAIILIGGYGQGMLAAI